jgi:hypothetical protein
VRGTGEVPQKHQKKRQSIYPSPKSVVTPGVVYTTRRK